jgi:hypothetical protein
MKTSKKDYMGINHVLICLNFFNVPQVKHYVIRAENLWLVGKNKLLASQSLPLNGKIMVEH